MVNSIYAERLREKAATLPLRPGVYIMRAQGGTVIYVGKSRALKNRVSQYFHGSAQNTKTDAMTGNIYDFDYILCDTEMEALTLENSLIKLYKPKYNILLKDDKGYPFIRVQLKEEYPTLALVSKIADDGASYFGPFGSRGVTQSLLETINSTVKLTT